MGKLLARIRLHVRRSINRLPRRLRGLGGPLLGGTIGLIGGIPGILIGLLLGYLVGQLIVQSGSDRKILDYFEYPSTQNFYEGEPGLAAWCALAVLVVSKNNGEAAGAAPAGNAPAEAPSEKTIKLVVLAACHAFTNPRSDPALMEHFSRLAWSGKENINSCLLAESLASRRASTKDAKNLGRFLYDLAEGKKAKNFAGEIRLILDPGSQDRTEPENPAAKIEKDPWKILGLAPGTPLQEVKAHYRKLAKLFHPDELQVLDEKHRDTAAQAFIAIKEAYKEITSAEISSTVC